MSKKQFPEQKAAWERRWHQAGAAIVTARLSPPAMAALDSMCGEFGCNRREVIEALLLGNVSLSATHARIAALMRKNELSREQAAMVVGERNNLRSQVSCGTRR